MADPKLPHIHVSALDGVKTMFYVIVGFGLIHIVARKYPNNSFANTWMNVFC